MKCSFLIRPLAALAALVPLPAFALDIALTNDDGWQSQGIQALYAALVAAGHTVTLAAPASEQSGSSAAINIGELRVRREAPDQFSVSVCVDKACTMLDGAEPATSAMVAIRVATDRSQGHPPALLVSGINSGNNAGAAAQISGTVGAAIAAISRPFNGQIPAIAVSTDAPPSCQGDSACLRTHYHAVATFLVRLIRKLERHRHGGGALLPAGIGLNINYPAGQPKGVRMGVQGRTITVGGIPRDLWIHCDGCADLKVGDSTRGGFAGMSEDRAPDLSRSDTVSFGEGYITIVPIEADYTARSRRGLEWLGELPVDGVVSATPKPPAED
jgi:5'/3'-nucleotidase